MNTYKTKHLLPLYFVVSVLQSPIVANAEVDTSEWLCVSCPFADGYRAQYQAGVSVVSDDAARFGNGSGYDTKGGYLELGGLGAYDHDGYHLEWSLNDLGLDSRSAGFEGGRQGSYDFSLSWRELPYRLFDTTQTIFTPDATGQLALPSSWIPASQTSGFTALDSALTRRNIGSDRQILDVGGQWLLSSGLSVYANLNRLDRDGIDITGGPGYTQSSLLPRVIDFQTDRIDLGLQYQSAATSLNLAYYGSYFSNQNSPLRWETPFSTAAGAERLQMATEPDNDFHQVSLSGTYHHQELWHSVIAFSVALGQGEQNETLLPYTINPNIAATLPQASLNAKVDTSHYALSVTSKPTSKSRLKLAYRLDEYDNKTASVDWTRVLVDLFDSGDPELNLPPGYKRAHLNLSGQLQLRKKLRLSAGYERTEFDRDHQEVAEQTENGGWGQLRWQPYGWLDLRARAGAAKREIDRYDTSVATAAGQNPLLRKYNLAYRYREYGEVTATASLTNKPIAFSASLFVTDDNYSKSQLGITGSEEMRFSGDASWAVSDTLSTYFAFGYESVDAIQLGSEGGGNTDWRATHDDQFNYYGIGFVRQNLTDKIDLKFDYTRADGKTNIFVSSNSGGPGGLPNLVSTQDSLRLEALYRATGRLETTMSLRYERLSVDDWALQGVEADTLPGILTLGADPYHYRVWALGVAFRYQIGDARLTLKD